ncbi:MAG: FKBP-type peptidyl-prolyl cis-trans isomerase [Deltaproteobacteria bacterium]|nr:FKBP-type peptidyl-prolyl cis-trans isomerase [Deltaproteobacteria bacterium]
MKTSLTTPILACTVLLFTVAACKAPPQRQGKPGDEVAAAEKPKTPEDPMVTSPPAEGADILAPSTVAAPPEDAEMTGSGMAHKLLSPGQATEHPGPTSQVMVHYTGWTTDGKMFDSSVKRQKPATFPLNKVIPGWGEGVQLMVVGERRRFWIPQELAYQGRPDRPQGMLVFDVELLSILTR